MGKWADKYVIGLTGNIGTGKSIVRKMLERLGALGLDADALGHRAIAKDAPGYLPVLNYFGRWILAPDGQIDRGRLGRIVFNDPVALSHLESIVHPLVYQAIDIIIRRANQPVIVVEAIKLFETELIKQVNTTWVVTADRDTRIHRLVKQRGMREKDAILRIDSQPSQEEKNDRAEVLIMNNGTFEEAYMQVQFHWRNISLPTSIMKEPVVTVASGKMTVRRGTPRDYDQIIKLVTRLDPEGQKRSKPQFMQSLNDNAFMLIEIGSQLVGMVGWQVENLICRSTDIFVDPAVPLSDSVPVLIDQVEKSAKDHQCEAALLFLPPSLARNTEVWKNLGYENRTPQSLEVQAWQEAALESMPFGTFMFFKQLRQDRVLRPI